MGKQPCAECPALCCQYLTIALDRPQTLEDFELIRWYLAHHRVMVYVEDGQWFAEIQNPCRHLTPDYRCAIYASRPAICREYRAKECEFTMRKEDFEYELCFRTDEEMARYIAVKFTNAAAKSEQTRRSKRRVLRAKKRS